MVLKKGGSGSSWPAPGYPDCRPPKQLGEAQKPKDVPSTKSARSAPISGQEVRRFGEFIACSNYPTCKYIQQKTIGVKCPNCSEGEVWSGAPSAARPSYGCNRYPECDFRGLGQTPSRAVVRNGGGSYLIEKFLKGRCGGAVP